MFLEFLQCTATGIGMGALIVGLARARELWVERRRAKRFADGVMAKLDEVERRHMVPECFGGPLDGERFTFRPDFCAGGEYERANHRWKWREHARRA